MINPKRISVVFSLAAYLLATTVVHALHDHSATCNRHSESPACAGPGCDPAGFGSEHHDSPSHSGDCEDSCLACRLLAVKSIAAVTVEVVQQTEVLQQVVARPCISAPVVRPDLPFSRGPPSAC
jgi:hypothetical protein